MNLEFFDNARARKKSDIDCCKALRNVVKYHKDIVVSSLARATGELASAKTSYAYEKREFENDDGGVGGPGFPESTRIPSCEKQVDEYKKDLATWEELDIFLSDQIEKNNP